MNNTTRPNAMRLEFGPWEKLHQDAKLIRFEVFVAEQKVPADIELDEMDPVCLHVVAYDQENQPMGTGRLLPDGHIGRMAVRAQARGTGVGGTILRALMEQAQLRGDTRVVLNAQTQATPFYGRFGFTVLGEEFESAGIPHLEMQYTFPAKTA